MSFAILTANQNEREAVSHFLNLDDNPLDTTKYTHANGRVWATDAFLDETKAKIEPRADKKNSYDVFCLEVDEVKHMGVHMSCDTIGPGGALHKTVELLKTAKDQRWKLRYIFLVGCCGASVDEREDCPRGTILLARQVKDYLNTGKVLDDGSVIGRPLNLDMGDEWLDKWEGVQSADRRNPHKIEMKRVNYLSGPLVIKQDLFGKKYREGNEVTGVEMEVVGVDEAVKIFHEIFGGPEVKVVLAKGVSDYTAKKGEKGNCIFFGRETHPVDDDSLQVYATLQSIALVIRFVAKHMQLIFK